MTILPIDEMKFGKKPAQHDARVIMLRDMMRELRLVTPHPSSPYWRIRWSRKLNITSTGTLGNTRVGNCCCASKLHTIQNWTAWTGRQAMFTEEQGLDLYRKISGWDGTPATDNGDTIVHVLNYWFRNGLYDHRIAGFAALQPGSIQDIKDSIWVFGSADIGLLLPRTCLTQEVWHLVSRSGDGAPGSAGGHDVNVTDFDDHARLLLCDTWGHTKQMSYDFFDFYSDEGYGCASPEWLLATRKTPSDYNMNDMIGYLNSKR